ncbi:MAG: GNAT family N-acetyltransferase [Terriglobales bacterium]|jgi:predicted acetyltransferase
MSPQAQSAIEIRTMVEQDRQRVLALHREAFPFPGYLLDRYRSAPLGNGRVLVEDGTVQAALHLMPFRQYFGRRSVMSCGVGGVKVAAEARQRGYGSRLLSSVLQELHASGAALSVLYPTGVAPYRKLGYEMAGSYNRFRVSVDKLPRASAGATLEPWGEGELGEIDGCYREFAAGRSGLLDREAAWWTERVLENHGAEIHRYLARTNGKVTGYVVYEQVPDPAESPYSYAFHCRELVWHDEASARALLSLFACQGPLGTALLWPGPPEDPSALLIGDCQITAAGRTFWMARVLQLAGALENREYPASLNLALEFELTDPVVRDNNGAFRLEIAHGTAHLLRIASAAARLDIGALSALYTGWLRPVDAAATGRLHNAPPGTLEVFEAAFPAAQSWMFDKF